MVVSNDICFSIVITIANELFHLISKHLIEDMHPKLLLGLHLFFVITPGTNTVKCRYEGLGCRFRIIFPDYCAPGVLSANRAFHSSVLPSQKYSQAGGIYRYTHYILFSHADSVKLRIDLSAFFHLCLRSFFKL